MNKYTFISIHRSLTFFLDLRKYSSGYPKFSLSICIYTPVISSNLITKNIKIIEVRKSKAELLNHTGLVHAVFYIAV